MRVCVALLMAYAAAAPAAETADQLAAAQSLAATGTPQLALDLVEKSQPPDAKAPNWAQWEELRCRLLARLNRLRELDERAERLPRPVAPPTLRECLAPLLRTAIRSGQGAQARRHAARLIWQGALSTEALQEIRLLVIDSYLADKRGDDAYRSMLRFDLDYRPLERRTAARFVAGLLELGMAREAVNWLASLDDAEPIKLMLRLQAGLIDPETAGKLARALAVKSPGAGWWGVAAHAARMQGNRVLQIEALERLLQHAAAGEPSQAASVRELWQLYLARARETADQQNLLSNDESAWSALAARRISAEPALGRALYAHLARRGASADARSNAQLQLELSLNNAKLEIAAVRLFADEEIAVPSLDPRLRYSLGAVAEARGLHAAAVRMWQGLPPPPAAAAIDWQLRVAAAMVRAGQTNAAGALLKQAADPGVVWTPEAARRASALALQLLEAGNAGPAEDLLTAILPRVDGLERRQLLFNLGRAAEANGKPLPAAEHYLRSAALLEPKPPDALAREARLAAGLSLVRGGYREDARAQFEWVLKHSRDPAQLEVARRELKKQ